MGRVRMGRARCEQTWERMLLWGSSKMFLSLSLPLCLFFFHLVPRLSFLSSFSAFIFSRVGRSSMPRILSSECDKHEEDKNELSSILLHRVLYDEILNNNIFAQSYMQTWYYINPLPSICLIFNFFLKFQRYRFFSNFFLILSRINLWFNCGDTLYTFGSLAPRRRSDTGFAWSRVPRHLFGIRINKASTLSISRARLGFYISFSAHTIPRVRGTP